MEMMKAIKKEHYSKHHSKSINMLKTIFFRTSFNNKIMCKH